jgi:hypothetical protein
MEKIQLHDVQGITCLSGVDEYGKMWTQFIVDFFAEQDEGTCFICGASLSIGWLCLDGGEEVCDKHVSY